MSRNMYGVFKQGREDVCEIEKDGSWTREEEFKKFLVAAKSAEYEDPRNDAWTDGVKNIITYTDPDFPEFMYRDTYYGSESVHGIETISIRGIEIYALTYSDIEYVSFDDKITECLAKALTTGPKVSPDNLRGADGTTDDSGRYEYHVWYNYINGHVSGTEIIIDTECVLVDGNVKIKVTDLSPAQLINYAGINDCIVYRCDFAGGMII